LIHFYKSCHRSQGGIEAPETLTRAAGCFLSCFPLLFLLPSMPMVA